MSLHFKRRSFISMRFSLVNGVREIPSKNKKGECLFCGREMISRCGKIREHHWAHVGKLECDPWRENETKWHRDWKVNFPSDWQEVIHRDEISGEKHIADVKTNEGWVIEFQHSYLKPDERKARNNFYKKIVWVVDGTRLRRDEENFVRAYNNGVQLNKLGKSINLEACSTLREWCIESAPVCFDFGNDALYVVLPKAPDGIPNVIKIPKVFFISEFQNINPQISYVLAIKKLLEAYYNQIHPEVIQTISIRQKDYIRPRFIRRGHRL